MPTSPPPESEYVFRLPHSALRIAAIAFGIGLFLFLVVWWLGRDQAFYKVEPAAQGKPLTDMAPLPEPLSSGDGASDMPSAGQVQSQEERPQLVETAPAPATLPMPIDETDTSSTTATEPVAPDLPAPAANAPGEQPVPLTSQNAAPRYPAAALRRGDSGTVLVRVEVDAGGAPTGVALVQRSGSRDLDRAAMEAVREWKFQPAQRDGQPVASSLVIPIDFKAGQ